MLIEAGGGSGGRKPSHKPKPRPSHGGGGGSSGGHPSHGNIPLPDWHPSRPAPAPRQESPRTWMGARLNPKPPDIPDTTFGATAIERAYRPPVDVRAQEEEAQRKAKLAMQRTRNLRVEALDELKADEPSTARGPKVDQMTWHEYNMLTPTQRAAVDFNTMLVRAVKKDLSHQGEYEDRTATQERRYEKATEKMFGSGDRGSDTYAPETLAVLKQINFHDNAADLDDFLNLKMAITDEDLKKIHLPVDTALNIPQFNDTVPQTQVQAVKRNLADNTAELEAKLADGNRMMASVMSIADRERNFILNQLGGTANTGKPAIGYQPPKYVPGSNEPADLNTYFIEAFARLSDSKEPAGQTLGRVREALHPDEYKLFTEYANDRSTNAMQFGQPLEDIPGVKYRTPQEFRKIMGLGRGLRNE